MVIVPPCKAEESLRSDVELARPPPGIEAQQRLEEGWTFWVCRIMEGPP